MFGVGDDDQTIYGYNGADPAWLIDFAELFPGAGEHPLEVNYRCPADVVEAADLLLRHNAVRVPKSIRAAATAVERGLHVESGDAPVDTTVDIVSRGRRRRHATVATSRSSRGSTRCSHRCRWRSASPASR